MLSKIRNDKQHTCCHKKNAACGVHASARASAYVCVCVSKCVCRCVCVYVCVYVCETSVELLPEYVHPRKGLMAGW